METELVVTVERGLDTRMIQEILEALEEMSSDDLEHWFRSLGEAEADELLESILFPNTHDAGVR